jgi:hypothetical protein|tara:strand:+ start:24051 stop:24920 length:870 start_codon:yes stop_codon:yes gene_type:complete
MSQVSTKRKVPNRNTNLNVNAFKPSRTVKSYKVVREVPELQQGVGMTCTYRGYIRYLNEIKAQLADVLHNGKRITVKFLEYDENANRGVVVNTAAQLLNRRYTLEFKNNGSEIPRINNSGGVYYFLVVVHKKNSTIGHAINVLVDTTRTGPRIWVFDPHGGESMNRRGFGSILRNKVLPNIKKFFGGAVESTIAKYYDGPNLQANNARGVCTTFHINFTQMIPHLLNGTMNITQLRNIPTNPVNRSAFLNRGFERNVTESRATKSNFKTPPKLEMTIGKADKSKKKTRR